MFDWLQNGEIALPTPAGDFEVNLSPESAKYWQQWTSSLGALVCGRTLFEVAKGWQGRHTLDVPVVVVTHGCRQSGLTHTRSDELSPCLGQTSHL